MKTIRIKWLCNLYIFKIAKKDLKTFSDMFRISYDPYDLKEQLDFMSVKYTFEDGGITS